MSCTPSPKAAKPVWAKQLTRLPCFVVYVKFQFVYTTKSKMSSQHLLASTSSHVQLWRGSDKAFHECLGVSNVFPNAAVVQTVVTYSQIHLILLPELADYSLKNIIGPLYSPKCDEYWWANFVLSELSKLFKRPIFSGVFSSHQRTPWWNIILEKPNQKISNSIAQPPFTVSPFMLSQPLIHCHS